MAQNDEGAWLVTTPRLDIALGGVGDAFSALLPRAFP